MRCLLLLLILGAWRPCLGCINDSTIDRAEAEFRGRYASIEASPDPGTSTPGRGTVAALAPGAGSLGPA